MKERTDLVALIGESVRLTRRGRTFVGLCPFHKEKTPSFHVNPERGIFHCFGCKESGSSVDFVMKVEGRTFPEAIRMLADRAGVQVAESSTDAEQREASAARRAKDDLYAVNHLAATYFEHALRGGVSGAPAHPLAHHAHAELARRGLSFGASEATNDTLQAFRIGYAPFGWDGLATFLRQQGVSPLAAEKVGLLVPRSSGSGHYDRFRHRLMFAVTDVMGRVIAFSGRSLDAPTADELARTGISGPSPTTDDGRAPAKYINSPESPIYTKGEHLFGLYQARHAVRQEGRGVLVEGNFDVVALHARGIGNVLAPLGTAFTAAQAKLLKRFAPAVVVLFDGDAAGRKATRASRGPCREVGLDAKVATLPKGVDPDDLVRNKGAEALAVILGSARGMLEYLIDDALDSEGFEAASASEKYARVNAAIEVIREEADPTIRLMADSYANQLSSRLVLNGRPADNLNDLHRRIIAASGSAPEPAVHRSQSTDPHTRAKSRVNVDQIPLEIIGALLDFPALIHDPEVGEALGAVEGDAALAIAALRRKTVWPGNCAAEGGTPDPQKGVYADEFLAQIPRSIHSFAVGRLASPRFELVSDAKIELLDNARKLKRLSLKRENAAGVDQLHRVEAQGDVAAVDELLREIDLRARKKQGLA